MNVEVEMKPIKSQANYRIAASLSPILVFYDAVSYMGRCFEPNVILFLTRPLWRQWSGCFFSLKMSTF